LASGRRTGEATRLIRAHCEAMEGASHRFERELSKHEEVKP